MPDRTPAALHDEAGRSLLRFERELAHPPERVWEALTVAADLASWHPTPCEISPEVGGAVIYRSAPGGPEMPSGKVLEYDAPRVLAYTWGEDDLRFELRPSAGGCVLTLTHAFGDRFKAARDAAGWHLCLEALIAGLDGGPAQQQPDAPRTPNGWRELNRDYERRFGIPTGSATPPPR